MHDFLPYIMAIIPTIGFLYLLAKDLFGAGGNLANKFAKHKEENTLVLADHKKSTDEKFTQLQNSQMQMRLDFLQSVQGNQDNSRAGMDAITANIHSLQLGFAEFRTAIAENYMRRDSYYIAAEKLEKAFDKKNDELKLDMKDGFDRVEKTLDEMSQAIEATRKFNKREFVSKA